METCILCYNGTHMRTLRFTLIIVLGLMPVGVAAQEPLGETAKQIIVEYLGGFLEKGEPARFDPPQPIYFEMSVWGQDAITGKIREVSSEMVIYLHSDYGRIGTRDRAFLPSGELSDLVINHDFAINREANWRHSRDKIEISENSGDQYRMTSNLLEIQRNVFRKLLRQGLYFNLDTDFRFQQIEGSANGWSAYWRLSDLDRELRVDGEGVLPERIVVRSIHYRSLGEDAAAGEWHRSVEFAGHRPIPWRTGQMAQEYRSFDPSGEPINRVEIRSIELLNEEDFANAVQTPDPQAGMVSLDAETVVDSRGIRSTEWTRQEEGFIEGSSQLKFGKLATYVGVAIACVVGVVLALVVVRRQA